jgi:hypothetical protein
MVTRARRRAAAALDFDAYEADAAEFTAAIEEERYRNLAGLSDTPNEEAVYQRWARLFSLERLEALHSALANPDAASAHGGLWRFAVNGYLNKAVARLTDEIAAAETRAVVPWRGEAIRYHGARSRISVISDRRERNALYRAWLRSVEDINPLRIERIDTLHAAVADAGFSGYVEMVRDTRGWNPDELAARVRGALNASETGYYAAMRRMMARIGIEQGDGTLADVWYILRGSGWDAWFEARRVAPTLEATFAGLGIRLRDLPGATLDVEPRATKPSGAYCATLRVPGDVRLFVNPRDGWSNMTAALHEAGHFVHFLHVPKDTPLSRGLYGDDSVTEGYAMLMDSLVGEPEWLADRLGMDEGDQMVFIDFVALWSLSNLRRLGGQLIYELGLHRGGEHAVHRAMYSGTLGLLAGVNWPEELYLSSVDDALNSGTDLRAMMLAGALDEELSRRYPNGWWRESKAGELLRGLFERGAAWNAEQVVAHLGYDALDWRPVLRKIRTQLIGEMSGYGGPNITTRAGTRKI